MSNYWLCRVLKAKESEDKCIRTVVIGCMPRKKLKLATYSPGPLNGKESAKLRLVLIVPMEERESVSVTEEDAA